jgi:hypothetical protein
MSVLLSNGIKLSQIVNSSESGDILHIGLIGEMLWRASGGQQNLISLFSSANYTTSSEPTMYCIIPCCIQWFDHHLVQLYVPQHQAW